MIESHIGSEVTWRSEYVGINAIMHRIVFVDCARCTNSSLYARRELRVSCETAMIIR